LSTTHIIVGAVIGISLADMKKLSDFWELQWSMLGRIVMSWVVTIPAAASVAMGFFAVLKVIHDQSK
jgi:inorganic phosphate transporter, PiT family